MSHSQKKVYMISHVHFNIDQLKRLIINYLNTLHHPNHIQKNQAFLPVKLYLHVVDAKLS